MIILYCLISLIIIIYLTYSNYKSRKIKGPKGSSGEQGDEGDRGEIGLTGPTGMQGNIGIRGPRGDNNGEPGPKGYPGYIGEQGPKGLKGYKGFRGDNGDQGERGTRGIIGPKGQTGLDGLIGNHGEYTYNEIDNDSCRFVLFTEDREVKCPFNYVLTGIKNNPDNYEGYCCKFKIKENCRNNSLARKLGDYKEKWVGTENEGNFITFEEQEEKNMFSDIHGSKYLQMYYLKNYKCTPLKRIIIQASSNNIQINQGCIDDDDILGICRFDNNNLEKTFVPSNVQNSSLSNVKINKGYALRTNKFTTINSLFSSYFADLIRSARLRLVIKDFDTLASMELVIINIELTVENEDDLTDAKNIILTLDRSDLNYELEIQKKVTNEKLKYENNIENGKIIIPLIDLESTSNVPSIQYDGNKIGLTDEDEYIEFKNKYTFERKFIDITDIFDNEIFKDRTPSLINKGVIRLINNNTSPTIEVKVTTPINLSKNAKIMNIIFDRNDLNIEIDLVTTFIPDSVSYENMFLKNELMDNFGNYKFNRWAYDDLQSSIEGDINSARCCTVDNDKINKFVEFSNLIKLDRELMVNNLQLDWDSIKKFMLEYPRVDNFIYKKFYNIINSKFMPLKNKYGSDKIITINNIEDFKEDDINAYLVADINDDKRNIGVYIISKEIIPNSSSITPESSDSYFVKVYKINKNFSNLNQINYLKLY